jgi:hypothetical protein
MEPEDIPVHDLLGVGDTPEPGPDELRAIVARAGRKRWAMAGMAATLALALGVGIGFATSHQSTPASQTAAAGPGPTTGQNATPGGSPAVGASPGGSPGYGAYMNPIAPASSRLARVFTRTAGGVTIRGFLVTFPQVFGASAACQLGGGSHLQVELSTAKMVAIAGGGLEAVNQSQPLSGVTSQVVGGPEGAPTAVVIAATGSGVAKVSMSFVGGGRDAMTPVNGWVALVAPVSGTLSYGSTLGTLSEQNSGGKVIHSQAVQLGVQSPTPAAPSCPVVCPDLSSPAGAKANSTTASGSATAGAKANSTTPSGSAAAGVACPPVPCSPLPRTTLPPRQTPSTTAANTVNPGGPVVSSSGSGGTAYACLVPPQASAGGSSSSGASP